METTASYPEFLAFLKQLVEERQSGTLFGRTEDNHAIIVSLRDGEIILLTYGPHQGEAAIPSFLHLKRLHYRFEPQVLSGNPYPLGTRGILEALSAGLEEVAEAPGDIDVAPTLERLRALLTDHIGPIAGMLVDEALDNLGTPRNREDLERLIEHLAKDAPPGFSAQARRLLG